MRPLTDHGAVLERRPYDAEANAGDVTCRVCGNPVILWFNGGELDSSTCCGLVYYTRATGYELIIAKDEP